MEMFTVFCKLPGDGRGQYSEEIDVIVPRRSETLAKRTAQMVIDQSGEYNPELRPVRVRRNSFVIMRMESDNE